MRSRLLLPLSLLVLCCCGRVERSGLSNGENALVNTGDSPSLKAPPTSNDPEAQQDKARHPSEKRPASVLISALPNTSSALVRMNFSSDANDVTIKVWGTDGLEVNSKDTLWTGCSFKNGETTQLDVTYAAPAHESNLAVSVSGVFGGRRQVQVKSFTVPGAAPAAPPVPTTTDAASRRVKVIQAQ